MPKTKKTKVAINNKHKDNVLGKKRSPNKTLYLLIFTLFIITFAAFANALGNEFLTWDDKDYITENDFIKNFSPEGIKTMFSIFVSCHYHPLTLVSLALDYNIWGYNPGGFIFTNLLLHALNTILVFLIFYKTTNKFEIAFITALIFSIHPMRSESVVWISERKDVLFSFFYFLSLYFYIKYLKSDLKWKYYIFSLLIFTASLFSKATAVSLPFVLLLFDYNLNRKEIKRLVLEKLPFFVLSLLFGIIAIKAQSLALPNNPPIIDRIFLITYAMTFYLFKFFAPFLQSAIIPFPESVGGFLPLKYYISVLIIPVVAIIFYKFKNVCKDLLFVSGFFISTLFLLLIKFPIGPAYLAERYTYLPYIGLGYFVGLMYYKYITEKKEGHNFKNIFFTALVLYCLFFFIKTINRNTVWKNSYSIFSDVVASNPTYSFALSNKGNALALENKHAEAIKEFDLAIKYKPDFADAYNNRATSLFALKDYEGVLRDLNTSIALDPDNAKIINMYNNRGLAYYKLGRYKEAISDFNIAISLKKDYFEAYKNRMQSYSAIRDFDKALEDLNYIISVEKNNAGNFNQKGIFYAEKGDTENAIAAFSEAVRLEPGNSSYYVNRGFVYLKTDINKACSDFSKSASLNNDAAKEIFQQTCVK